MPYAEPWKVFHVGYREVPRIQSISQIKAIAVRTATALRFSIVTWEQDGEQFFTPDHGWDYASKPTSIVHGVALPCGCVITRKGMKNHYTVDWCSEHSIEHLIEKTSNYSLGPDGRYTVYFTTGDSLNSMYIHFDYKDSHWHSFNCFGGYFGTHYGHIREVHGRFRNMAFNVDDIRVLETELKRLARALVKLI